MPLLTVPLVARRLGCAAAHVKRLAARGAFPGAKLVSGQWRIPLAAVLAFLKHPRKASVDPAAPRPVAAREVRTPLCFFRCSSLDGALLARVCVKRQVEAERQLHGREKAADTELRRHDKKRGVAAEFVCCRTEMCAEGRAIRARLGDEVADAVRHGVSIDRNGQHAAEAKTRAADPGLERTSAGFAVPTGANRVFAMSGSSDGALAGDDVDGCALVTVAVGEPGPGR